ncbi:hypothetical protein KJ940_09005, partial [Myxococcota bacterium]|nr:hypothetical protein [Myxococcota bacterium]
MHRAPPRRALACLLSAAPPSLQAYAASSAALRLSGYPDERAGQATRAGRGEAAPRVWGLDAEMVRTTRGEEIAWLALVEWRDAKTDAPFDWTSDRPYRVVTRLNLYIQPEGEILDLLTPYSGLRAEDLRGVTRRLGAARDALLTHLRAEDYLCGHGLDHDLHALDLYHPRILDTALIYPHPEGPPALHALSALALTHLGLEIQRDGHSPAEDASTALTLLKRALDEGAPPLQWRALPAEATGAFEALSLSEALRHLEIPDAHVRCAFLRGSRATQTAGQRPDGGPSDWDLVLVVEAAARPIEDLHLRYGDIDAALYDVPAFRRLLRRCTIWALECVYAPPHAILREEIGFKAELARDLRALPREAFSARLRQSVMYEAGRQWSKAKRDLERRGSPYQCRKRIFIALRFLTYGVEVAQSYEIKDIRCLNALWFEALRDDPSPTWAALDARYGPRYRALQAQLRAAAPQAPRYGGLKAPRRDLKPQEA